MTTTTYVATAFSVDDFGPYKGLHSPSARWNGWLMPLFTADVVRDIAADLAKNPVSPDELQRAIAPMRQLLARVSTGNAFWMKQMEGATRDPRYVEAMQTMGRDLLNVSAADLQALAAKYLVPGKSWSAVVLPEGVEAK